ncbi:MAG TPA: DUF4097 family beta strand repeat-containing protein [Rhodothermales bacterium]|nr:DUF4097 family beta strand repeat-containing protein [Rhodothermales bacterium]
MKHLKTHRLASAFLLLVPLLLGSATGNAQDLRDTIKETFKVRPGGTLHIDIDHGDVQVTSAQGNEVLVEVERIAETNDRSDAADMFKRHSVSLEQREGDVYVKGRYDEAGSTWGRWRDHSKLRVRVFVRVPDRYNVDFTSGAGNIEITNLQGNVSGSTGAGNLKLTSIRGTTELTSGSGNVVVNQATGRIEINTGAGNVDLKGIQGALEVRTGAGNVTAEIAGQPRADSHLESGAGNITVFVGHQIGMDVDASASIGSLSTDFPLKIEGSFMRKTCEGSINGGGPALRMRTGVGNVTLRKL